MRLPIAAGCIRALHQFLIVSDTQNAWVLAHRTLSICTHRLRLININDSMTHTVYKSFFIFCKGMLLKCLGYHMLAYYWLPSLLGGGGQHILKHLICSWMNVHKKWCSPWCQGFDMFWSILPIVSQIYAEGNNISRKKTLFQYGKTNAPTEKNDALHNALNCYELLMLKLSKKRRQKQIQKKNFIWNPNFEANYMGRMPMPSWPLSWKKSGLVAGGRRNPPLWMVAKSCRSW